MLFAIGLFLGILVGWALGIVTSMYVDSRHQKDLQIITQAEPLKAALPMTQKDGSEKFNEYLQKRVDVLETRETVHGNGKEVNDTLIPYLKARIEELEKREKEYVQIIASRPAHVPASGNPSKEQTPKKLQTSLLDASP
jgi:hypothetical protein